jgi:thymidylate synthase
MKADIMSTRLKVQAWNPLELDKTALPPCHSQFQIIGVPLADGKYGFELHWYQRSNDVFLGNPYNFASYGALALILEKITGYKALAIQADMKCVHLYENQIEAAKEMITRDCLKFEKCELEIKDFKNFEDLLPSDFKLVNYDSFQAIKVEMVAPTSI